MLPLRKIIKISRKICTSETYKDAQKAFFIESQKTPSRYEIINFLLGKKQSETTRYLEIGVRNPQANFNRINATEKYGVDPGIEFEENPVNFKMTSDAFFDQLKKGEVLSQDIKFDVVFIDGLHVSDQVERDIYNSLTFLKEDGFIAIHDCNPPTEYHAREDRLFQLSPALKSWYGTAWKAFYKCRLDPALSCCCIDSDCGVGIVTREKYFSHLDTDINPFFEFAILERTRKHSLNLIDFDEFQQVINSQE